MKIPKLIFLFGVGRSGTTLLQSMLHAHPSITMLPENHLIHDFLLKEVANGSSLELNAVLNSEGFKRLGNLVDIEKVSNSSSIKMLFQSITAQIAKKKNTLFIGDKDPEHINYLPHLEKAFPNALFIHIIRDPRDVILSRKKSKWGAKYPWQWHITEYEHQFNKAKVFGHQNNRFYEVYYEKLVDEPELSLKGLCGFLGIPFSEEMMRYNQSASDLVSENEKKWKQNVSKPVMKGNYGKWKKELGSAHLKQIESVLWNSPVFKYYKKSEYKKPLLPIFQKLIYAVLKQYILRKDKKKYSL